MKPQIRPLPAIVENVLGQIYTLAGGNENLLKVKARSSEEWFAHRDAELLEANKVLLQAVRQLIEDAMPPSKDASDFLNVPYASASKDARLTANGMRDGYTTAIDHIRSNLLAGLEK